MVFPSCCVLLVSFLQLPLAQDPPLGSELDAVQTAAPRFVNRAAELGLGADSFARPVARVAFVDFDADGFPDLLVDRGRIFRNRADPTVLGGRRFEELSTKETGLEELDARALCVAADFDNDGHADLLITEYVDAQKPGWEDAGRRTHLRRGNGDGSFQEARPVPGLRPATTSAIAVGDVDRNGSLDLFLGNWYTNYGSSYLGYRNDLCLMVSGPKGFSSLLAFELPTPAVLGDATGTEDVDHNWDGDGRPTYGALIADLDGGFRPELLELNYGRRWNRLWRWDSEALRFTDDAPRTRFDGDDTRDAGYPEWAVTRFLERKPPIVLERELPFRSNGNSFDAAIGDVDRDGDFDVFVTEITHAWAGDSADRSGVLINRLEDGELVFARDPKWNVDRIPGGLESWNQGDLFGAFADLDQDGFLELLISSGDYPDDQRLRVYSMLPSGPLERTSEWGFDHVGSQQLSLADVEGDGDLDVIVGQTFNRFTAAQKEGRTPLPALWINEVAPRGTSLELFLEGDGRSVARDALGAVCEVELAAPEPGASPPPPLLRQLVGIGGHAGKQDGFLVHFGLGGTAPIARLTIRWPDAAGTTDVFENLAPGRYRVVFGGEVDPAKASEKGAHAVLTPYPLGL